eukprot:SAG31_NODE_3034_length_4763_cov_8.243782_1_plen_567_part_10
MGEGTGSSDRVSVKFRTCQSCERSVREPETGCDGWDSSDCASGQWVVSNRLCQPVNVYSKADGLIEDYHTENGNWMCRALVPYSADPGNSSHAEMGSIVGVTADVVSVHCNIEYDGGGDWTNLPTGVFSGALCVPICNRTLECCGRGHIYSGQCRCDLGRTGHLCDAILDYEHRMPNYNSGFGTFHQQSITLALDVSPSVTAILEAADRLQVLSKDLHAMDKRGASPVLAAAAAGQHVAVRALLMDPSAADPTSVDKQGNNALMLAARRGSLSTCEMLLESGRIGVAGRSRNGSSALSEAANAAAAPVLQLLLDHDSIEDRKGLEVRDYTTAIHAAYTKDDRACLTALLGAGAAKPEQLPQLLLGKLGVKKDTALHTAAAAGSLAAVQVVLAAAAGHDAIDDGSGGLGKKCLTAPNGAGLPPLCMAVEGGHTSAVNALLEAGASSSVGEGGLSALMIACEYDRHDVVERLLPALTFESITQMQAHFDVFTAFTDNFLDACLAYFNMRYPKPKPSPPPPAGLPRYRMRQTAVMIERQQACGTCYMETVVIILADCQIQSVCANEALQR